MNFVSVAVLFEGGLAVLAVAIGWLLGYDPLVHVHWTWAAAGCGIAGTLPPLLLLLWSSRTTWGPLERLTRLVRWLIRPYFAHATWLDFALISIAAGIGEELLFRGFLQAMLGSWFNPWVGLVLASVVFGLAHYLSHTYACLATLLGVYLGGLWLACDNLLAPMITHALYDFVALVYLLRIDRETSTSFHG